MNMFGLDYDGLGFVGWYGLLRSDTEWIILAWIGVG